ncbi:MAG: glycogen/starch/alpha-glucan phosphorylase [Gemmiger formicilis]|uniref:glycogen/starch/alpha-glucan phosphorylase n=1 Tax=Gemmiger formicilis TaxID=745368 RepID=UPI002A669609|nr:glycogen/starch/alpha-glucan phosphorylase [Gemmiger formicilis]MCI6896493.1 glycogen/starch/alpha-glucan phosphorylase [Gemmiger formicilis]MDD5840161.1 glycogen/starch/alpha-glucan phosphorylase [Gemmiger formicilis]MDD6392644.1 glycogen/starch/alpha-glucan phosphorylase [Gemmiger formicilis]MDD6523252.1 glycogen/starch/alpha-glucan phosphorylase [Gemmiger formicilis]
MTAKKERTILKYTKREFEKLLKDKLMSECNVTIDAASADQIYRCLAMITRQIMSDRQKQYQSKVLGEGKKQVYYLCMEFLMGRSLRTSLFNLGLNEVAESVLADADIKIDTIYEQEPDAGLGNGGLGRLAACYLDGMATDGIPGTGYSILYEYGIFKQKIVDGWQQETADNWLPGGQVWIKSHPDQAQEIRFDGQAIETWEGGFHHVKYENYNSVIAVPNDMYVAGYGSNGVSKLRLWQAKAPSFDMSSFNAGNYNTAISQSASAELISKILYPNDNHTEGKILRLRQQYFFSAASIADILQNHLNQYGTLDNLADKVAIQLNDTHPTVAIPEMMRILLDECSYEWDAAFDICRKVFAYTNHTVMSEALEKWNADIFRNTLPRIWQIVCEMDRRCRADLAKAFPGDQGKIDYMAIIGDNQVRTANICAYTCHAINGVSKLHSEIIKDSVFHDYFLYKPQAFKNVTNGIAYRRWLLCSNPGLTHLLEETIGDGFKTDASELKKLEKFVDDKTVQAAAAKVKRENKANFANYLQKATGQVIDPDSIFDCQVKRMHEYKRQHLNALNIAAEYLYLKNNPNAEFTPKTYIFGAKAAPGYYMAKQMIRMICKLGKLIDEDPAVRGKLRIVYLEDYCVSLSERLMPASEVSEQISLAGTEASGTGNMKFMLNGAITLGTLDGANVEIADAAGHENEIIFGMLTPEVNALKGMGYHPNAFINGDNTAMAVLDFLEKGWNGENFNEVTSNLRNSDPYMVMADFKDYRRAQHDLQELYRDKQKWNHMSLKNISNAGIFSADRSIMDYARDIWGATPVK